MVSLIRKLIPAEVRIPCYIVVIATFVTMVKLIMSAYFPELQASLGIFLPLIVVNCIILGRAEAFASKNNPFTSIIDGIGMGLGFTFALSLIGIIREILGEGKILGIPISDGFTANSMKIFILAPGGFLVMGLLLGLFNYLGARRERRLALAAKGIANKSDNPDLDATGGEKYNG
jgi:electron transport complex protein RnfE